MKHGKFIENMARYKSEGIWENYQARHANDPQCPMLSDWTHYLVCSVGKQIDLSSLAAIRKDLLSKFKAQSLDGKLNYKRNGVPRLLLRKVMEASGLRWFELNGNPVIHWDEKL